MELGHRDLEVSIDFPAVARLDLVLDLVELAEHRLHLLGRQFGAELLAQLLLALDHLADRRDGDLDVAEHRLVLVELGLLRYVADRLAVGQAGDTVIFGVLPRHDPKQGRLAGTVLTDDADLGVIQEDQTDLLEHGLPAVGLGQLFQRKYGLAAHGAEEGIPNSVPLTPRRMPQIILSWAFPA